MKIINRAILRTAEQPERKLALFRVETKCFRWVTEPAGQPFDGIDYLSDHDAIKALRVLVETSPDYVGVDLTILPAEPAPEERAARRIVDDKECIFDEFADLAHERIAEIIRQETGVDKLVESINLLLTYEFPRRLHPKQPGLDMTWGGLCLSVIEALEVATKTDLSNLKQQLAKGIETVKVYSSLPATGKVN